MSKKSRIIQGIISITIGMLLCYFYLVPMTTELAKDETINEASRVLISIMPIIYILVVIVGAMSIMFATNYIVTYLKWRAFGNRLKAAYTAKFGGENIGFNQEVDQRINVMRSLGKGSTKSLAEDWLKRIAKFVEVPWAIPVEERLSEAEKTNNFSDENINKKEEEQ